MKAARLRVYQGSGGRGFWNADIYNQFPPETQDYVPMVIAAAWLFLHPKQYGLSLPRVDATAGAIAAGETGVDLRAGDLPGQPRRARGLHACAAQPQSALRARQLAAGGNDPECNDAGSSASTAATALQGPRAELAAQLVRSDPNSAIVRTGTIEPLPMTDRPRRTAVPTTDRHRQARAGEGQAATTACSAAKR